MTIVSTYLIVVLSLIFLIYLAPGIALFPSFILSPKTAATIPFISVSIVITIQYLLTLQGQFNHQNILIIISIIALISIYRVFKILSVNKFNWVRSDIKGLLLITFSCIPLMIILGSDGFQHADEIYSWNTWAKKIYLNQPVTFESTQAPYPLALPSLIAFCYKFLGNYDYQLPVKFSYSIIYIATVFSIFSFTKSRLENGIFFITFIFVMLVIGVGYEYKKVYADTLMGGFLLASIALLISISDTKSKSQKNISNTSILIASIILICSASLAKQGAFPWSLFFYPLLAFIIINKNEKIPSFMKFALIIPILTPILWYEIDGKGFNGNSGVIGRSMSGRDYFDQFFFGFTESFINHPFILIFMISVLIILLNKRSLEKNILALGIFTSTLLLIFFGAYETNRLYLHILLIGWLIITFYCDEFQHNFVVINLSKIGNSVYSFFVIALLFIFWTISTFNYKLNVLETVDDILDGMEVQANWIIGKDGAKQYRDIIESNMGFWAQDSHIWGIFYGLDNFYRGENLSTTDIKSITDSMIKNNIGWIYSTEIGIERLQNFCQQSVEKIETSKNPYNQILYKINIDYLQECKNRMN